MVLYRYKKRIFYSLSNQQKRNIKKYFIELVEILKESNILEDEYEIISSSRFHTRQE